MDKSDWFGRRWGRRSTTARANARMACKSGAWGQNIVSDVEKTAGVQWMGTRVARLAGRESSDTFMIREKGRLKFLYPRVRVHNYTFKLIYIIY